MTLKAGLSKIFEIFKTGSTPANEKDKGCILKFS
jgi:hypothetical protein